MTTDSPYAYSPDGTDPGSGYGYPSEVPWSKVQRFLEEIGVDPIDRETLMAVEIRPSGVIIERARVRETPDGTRRKYVTSKDGKLTASQITTCRIDWEA